MDAPQSDLIEVICQADLSFQSLLHVLYILGIKNTFNRYYNLLYIYITIVQLFQDEDGDAAHEFLVEDEAESLAVRAVFVLAGHRRAPHHLGHSWPLSPALERCISYKLI